jgi:hypothetical protein
VRRDTQSHPDARENPLFHAADLDDARTVGATQPGVPTRPHVMRAHGCGSVPDSDRLPLARWIALS